MRVLFLMLAISATSCGEGGTGTAGSEPVVFIGDTPKDITAFASTNCVMPNFADCTARDVQGRQYVFFDGALSRISIDRDDANPGVVLPAEMVFGESIEVSREKVSSLYRINFDRGEVDGRTIYSSEFNISSPSGVEYSIELIADEHNRLKEVVQRTDF